MNAMYNCPICSTFLQSAGQYKEHLLGHINNLVEILNSLQSPETNDDYVVISKSSQKQNVHTPTGTPADNKEDKAGQSHPTAETTPNEEKSSNQQQDQLKPGKPVTGTIRCPDVSGGPAVYETLPEMKKYTKLIGQQKKETAESILDAVEVWIHEVRQTQSLSTSSSRKRRFVLPVLETVPVTKTTAAKLKVKKKLDPDYIPSELTDRDKTFSKLDLGDYQCCQCHRSFAFKSKLKGHMISHSQDKNYKCPLCAMKFFRDGDVKSHMIRVHQINMSNDQLYESMIKKQVPDTSEQVYCDQCGADFEKHWVKLPSPKPKEEFKCEQCDTKFIRKASLQRHKSEVHAEIKAYECPLCKKEFIRKSAVRRHLIKSHSRKKSDEIFKRSFLKPGIRKGRNMDDGEHTCPYCMKVFIKRRHLLDHLRTHTGETPFICSECGNGFRQQSSLRSHMRIHTEEKPFTCDFCPVKFRHKNALTDHMRIHTGEKPYKCDVCNKTFAQRGTLVQHLRTHTGEKPFVCNSCNKKFTQRNGLRSHRKICNGTISQETPICIETPEQKVTGNKINVSKSTNGVSTSLPKDNMVVKSEEAMAIKSEATRIASFVNESEPVSLSTAIPNNTKVEKMDKPKSPKPASPPKKRKAVREKANRDAMLEAQGINVAEIEASDANGRPDLLKLLAKQGFSFLKDNNTDDIKSNIDVNIPSNCMYSGQGLVDTKTVQSHRQIPAKNTGLYTNTVQTKMTSVISERTAEESIGNDGPSSPINEPKQIPLSRDDYSDLPTYREKVERFVTTSYPKSIPLSRDDGGDILNNSYRNLVTDRPYSSSELSPYSTISSDASIPETRPQHVQPGFLFPRNRAAPDITLEPELQHYPTTNEALEALAYGMRQTYVPPVSFFPYSVSPSSVLYSSETATGTAQSSIYSRNMESGIEEMQYGRLPPISTLPKSNDRPNRYSGLFHMPTATNIENNESERKDVTYEDLYSQNIAYPEHSVGQNDFKT